MTVRKIRKGDTAALLEMSSELWPKFGKDDLMKGIDEVFASPREEGLVCKGFSKDESCCHIGRGRRRMVHHKRMY